MESLGLFFENWELFAHPTLAGTFAGAALGLVGVWIVLRRMVFLSATLSQTAGLGVALAAWISGAMSWAWLSPSMGAVALTVTTALILARARGAASDRVLGGLYLCASSLTLVAAARMPGELRDVESLLFGSAVAVVPADFWVLTVVCGALVALHLWWRRGFTAIVVDAEGARVAGLPTRVLEVALSGSIAVGLAAVTYVLGALPAFAFSVIPAMGALAVASSLPRALVIAASVGATAGFGGYLAAFLFDLPVGPSQTLLAAALAAPMLLARRSR